MLTSKVNRALLFSLSRCYSQKPPGFLSKVIENIQQEFSKNKEMKDNIAKFRDEAQKLEQTDALKQARRKFQIVESEASKSSEVLKEHLDKVKDKLKEASQSEFAKKASEMGEQLGKQAQNVAGTFSETGTKLASSSPYKAMSGAAAAMKEELTENQLEDRIYRAPKKLRKRVDIFAKSEQQFIEPNTEAIGVELHKDSKFYQSWEKFKDTNPYVHKMMDWKIKYDESENPVIRASKVLTSKVSDIMGGMFQPTELSGTLTEIMSIDPTFNKDIFVRDLQKDIIPNILEAIVRGDLEILKDWCYEPVYAMLSQPLIALQNAGIKSASRVLDVSNVDLVIGKILEQGPVLVFTFTAQQVLCFLDPNGKLYQGDPDKVLRVSYAWVMCRDRNELDPRAAWRLLEYSSSATEQLL